MKKIFVLICFMIASAAHAQTPAPVAPQPVEPVIAPKAKAQPAKETVTPITVSNSQNDGVPTLNRPDPVSFNAKLGVGSAFGPSAFWATGDLEVQLDKFVAIGPKIQYGTNSTTDFLYGSVGPRFTIPFSYFELGFNMGFGIAYRNVAGFEFNNFLYQTGVNFDVYLFQNLSVGLGYSANVISTAADTMLSVLVVTAGGHF